MVDIEMSVPSDSNLLMTLEIGESRESIVSNLTHKLLLFTKFNDYTDTCSTIVPGIWIKVSIREERLDTYLVDE